MTPDTENRTEAARSPEAIDRLHLGVCGAVWLLALAVWAVATVGLVNLGRGHDTGTGGSTRALYVVIAVSALTIIVAIPLLLKARRAALQTQQAATGEQAVEAPSRPAAMRAEARTEKMRVFGSDVDLAERRAPQSTAATATAAAVERIVLRGTAWLLTVMGGATTLVGAATYLMARHWMTASWVTLGLAAVVIGATPAVLIALLRRLPHQD